MIRVNIQEAKTHLSRYLGAAESGEVVVLCRHNKPVAELRPILAAPASAGTPRFGLWDGFGVSETFFEALPGDLIQAFNGE
jgi:prevent-host-death family protein